MALFGTVTTVREQLQLRFPLEGVWAYVEAALREGDPVRARILGVGVGKTERVELDGGAFALEQAYLSKVREGAFFESHKKYIDFQLVIAGEEIMEVTDVKTLLVKQDLTPEKDLLFYHTGSAHSALWVRAGSLAVFAPADAHRPSLAVAAPREVWKTVIKVPVL